MPSGIFIYITESKCLPKMACMMFGERLSQRLAEIGMTKYRLAKCSGVPESSVINIANGKRRPTDEILQKFSSVKELEVEFDTLQAWRLMDDYPLGAIEKAFNEASTLDPERIEKLKTIEKERASKKDG